MSPWLQEEGEQKPQHGACARAEDLASSNLDVAITALVAALLERPRPQRPAVIVGGSQFKLSLATVARG